MRSRAACLILVIASGSAIAHPLEELDVSKPIDPKQLKALTLDELRFLRDVIHARHGRTFESPSLNAWFASRDWYKPDPAWAAGWAPPERSCSNARRYGSPDGLPDVIVTNPVRSGDARYRRTPRCTLVTHVESNWSKPRSPA